MISSGSDTVQAFINVYSRTANPTVTISWFQKHLFEIMLPDLISDYEKNSTCKSLGSLIIFYGNFKLMNNSYECIPTMLLIKIILAISRDHELLMLRTQFPKKSWSIHHSIKNNSVQPCRNQYVPSSNFTMSEKS